MQEVFEKIIKILEHKLKKSEVVYHSYLDELNLSIIYDISDIAEERVYTIKEILEIVKQAESEYNNGWIPCSERFPEEYGNYNVSCKNKDGKEWTTTMVWCNELFGGQESIHRLVVAWQPLPEPYQPKGE